MSEERNTEHLPSRGFPNVSPTASSNPDQVVPTGILHENGSCSPDQAISTGILHCWAKIWQAETWQEEARSRRARTALLPGAEGLLLPTQHQTTLPVPQDATRSAAPWGQPQGNTQKLIRERKLKAEALRTAAASTHKASEDLALRLDEHVAAVMAGAKEVAKFEAHITATKTVIGKLEAKATSALVSPELTAFLGNPRAVYAAAGRLPDDVVQSLLPLLTAYLDTQDPDVIIACSQPAPEEDLVDAAAQLQTLRAEHEGEVQSLEKTMQSLEQTLQSREQTIESCKQTIQTLEQTIHSLQADLAAAKPLAASVLALTKERDTALATIQTLHSNLNAVEALEGRCPCSPRSGRHFKPILLQSRPWRHRFPRS